MQRIKYCAGNWKMNKTPSETKSFMEELRSKFTKSKCKVIIFPPAYNLVTLKDSVGTLPLEFGPQNIYFTSEGAFTGEISPAAAKSIGCRFALIGHSERRTLFHETNEDCHKKLKAAIATGLTPMLCVGETLSEREAGQTEVVVLKQLQIALAGVTAEIVIAYEPVWAIGTGKVATPEQAEDVHRFIRESLCKILSSEAAEKTSILYGGSVKPDNAAGLSEKPNIDGFLIGGASLNPTDFLKLIETY